MPLPLNLEKVSPPPIIPLFQPPSGDLCLFIASCLCLCLKSVLPPHFSSPKRIFFFQIFKKYILLLNVYVPSVAHFFCGCVCGSVCNNEFLPLKQAHHPISPRQSIFVTTLRGVVESSVYMQVIALLNKTRICVLLINVHLQP